MPKKWYYRWASSLGGGFEGTPEKVWGVKKYNPVKHINENCVFCGLYSLKDFYALWQHKGRKAIWWCGSDIRHFYNGYWLDSIGKIRITPFQIARWINANCESWVENKIEYKMLKFLGINSKICPSFLGDVNKFKPQKLNKELRFYSSVSGNDFELYGWERINNIATQSSNVKYYLYGNTIGWKAPKNIIVRGRVSNKIMNKETKTMTGAIRMVEFEGFSEILCKSILWGQKPISLIDYPFLRSKNPRKELLKSLNKFPWNGRI